MRIAALLILVLAAVGVACGCLWQSGVVQLPRSVADPVPVGKDESAHNDANNPLASAATGNLRPTRPLPVVTLNYELGNRVH